MVHCGVYTSIIKISLLSSLYYIAGSGAYTSIVNISLLSSLYHIAGKQPGNLNVSFYVIQHSLPQCPQTDSVGGNDANYAKAGVNPYEWQTWSYTTSIPHLIIQHLKDYISPSI